MALDKFSLFVPGKDSVTTKEDEHQPSKYLQSLYNFFFFLI